MLQYQQTMMPQQKWQQRQ